LRERFTCLNANCPYSSEDWNEFNDHQQTEKHYNFKIENLEPPKPK
jgi:hypothetical protein